jgi:DNA-binding beta-propeller fold protein YncE
LPTTTQQTCNLVGATAGAVAGTVTGPVDVVFDCPHFAYVTNEGDSTLSTYQVDNASGALTVPSSIPTIAVPYLITTTPNLAFAFVTSINNTTQGANGVDVYGINANNGVLSANGSPASGIQAYGLAFDPTGTYAIQPDFVAGNVSVYNVGGNGALTLVGGGPYAAGTNPDAVAVTHDGKYAYVPSGHGGTLYGYSLGAGTLTGLSSSPVTVSGAGGLAGLAIDPLGKFIYIGGNTTGNVFGYSIDDTTGALTAIAPGTFAAGANPSCVTIHPNGKFLYVANYGSDNVSGYLINPSSGALAPMAGSPFGTGINPESLTIDPAGQYAYVVNTRLNAVPAGTAGTVSVFSINQTSGVLTQITGSPFTAGINPQTMMFR